MEITLCPSWAAAQKIQNSKSFGPTAHCFFPEGVKKCSFWAAAPKGMMSCRTQRDFRTFIRFSVCPPQALSDLKSALLGNGLWYYYNYFLDLTIFYMWTACVARRQFLYIWGKFLVWCLSNFAHILAFHSAPRRSCVFSVE